MYHRRRVAVCRGDRPSLLRGRLAVAAITAITANEAPHHADCNRFFRATTTDWLNAKGRCCHNRQLVQSCHDDTLADLDSLSSLARLQIDLISG